MLIMSPNGFIISMGRKQKQRQQELQIGFDNPEDQSNSNTHVGDLFVILYGIAERLNSDPKAPDFIKEIAGGNK